jgi:hypothetical protein
LHYSEFPIRIQTLNHSSFDNPSPTPEGTSVSMAAAFFIILHLLSAELYYVKIDAAIDFLEVVLEGIVLFSDFLITRWVTFYERQQRERSGHSQEPYPFLVQGHFHLICQLLSVSLSIPGNNSLSPLKPTGRSVQGYNTVIVASYPGRGNFECFSLELSSFFQPRTSSSTYCTRRSCTQTVPCRKPSEQPLSESALDIQVRAPLVNVPRLVGY